MPDFKETRSKLAEMLSAKRRPGFIMTLGLAGMALILLSQWTGFPAAKQAAAPAEPQTEAAATPGDDYAARLELKLTGLIEEISGVGRAKVMVMLENTGEAVYAREERRSLDRGGQSGAVEASAAVSVRESTEDNYVLIDNGYGQKEALIETQLEPKIRGVVIVCEGAGDIYVQERLVHVVTTALGIPSTRVCVEKIK